MINAGVYVCQTHGSDVDPEPMLLTVVSTGTPSPNDVPEVIIPVKSVSIPSGESNKVDCFPHGKPQPLIRWSKVSSWLSNHHVASPIIKKTPGAMGRLAGYVLCGHALLGIALLVRH